jgi:hypothetical protein
MEPLQLKRGKEFQEMVQADYFKNSKGGGVGIEKDVNYNGGKNRAKGRYGRMDILIDDRDKDYVMIMEIKATDWDRIKPKNYRRNLWRHGRQLHKYIDKFLEVDKLGSVGLAMIYPSAPKKEGLRAKIEEMAMNQYSFPVYWYDEIKT